MFNKNPRLLRRNTVPLVDSYDDVKRFFKEFVKDFIIIFQMPIKRQEIKLYLRPAALISYFL